MLPTASVINRKLDRSRRTADDCWRPNTATVGGSLSILIPLMCLINISLIVINCMKLIAELQLIVFSK